MELGKIFSLGVWSIPQHCHFQGLSIKTFEKFLSICFSSLLFPISHFFRLMLKRFQKYSNYTHAMTFIISPIQVLPFLWGKEMCVVKVQPKHTLAHVGRGSWQLNTLELFCCIYLLNLSEGEIKADIWERERIHDLFVNTERTLESPSFASFPALPTYPDVFLALSFQSFQAALKCHSSSGDSPVPLSRLRAV